MLKMILMRRILMKQIKSKSHYSVPLSNNEFDILKYFLKTDKIASTKLDDFYKYTMDNLHSRDIVKAEIIDKDNDDVIYRFNDDKYILETVKETDMIKETKSLFTAINSMQSGLGGEMDASKVLFAANELQQKISKTVETIMNIRNDVFQLKIFMETIDGYDSDQINSFHSTLDDSLSEFADIGATVSTTFQEMIASLAEGEGSAMSGDKPANPDTDTDMMGEDEEFFDEMDEELDDENFDEDFADERPENPRHQKSTRSGKLRDR